MDKAALVLEVSSARAVLIRTAAVSPSDRDREAEAALRQACGRADIAIRRRPSGRPALAPPYPELGVSLSHREVWLLAAFSPVARVGADVEPEGRDLDPAGLAADNFTAAETRVIAGLTDPEARGAFLRMWVAKEAALKVTGRGIYDGLDEPDLAPVFATLWRDGAVADLPASSRLPALRLAVCRIVDDGKAVYCALAVEAS